ncbi:restriction endonuclease subunit S [Lactococcus lactis]|uniref:restriction endonuclease subunit S n=1 Tax=Lactococcus lactis TaxID=1358 RepID=UPI00288CDEE8|nr:restriction endonuclease subunit S [Lactococcus lactis]MDT2896068.1 restriction endonuclease subunit S [Lactococcus lactis]
MAKIDDSVKKKVPELRFKGFTDDWEERKLSDIADRFDNLRVPITASDRKSGDTPYYGANGIQDYVEGFTHDGEFILVAEDGANDLKNYPVQYVNGKVWVNNHAHVLQGKNTITDNKFLMNSIKNFNIEPFLVGGGRAKLNADVMMKLNILLPTFDEQEKIGSFFSLLDDTIALHQRKLDLLKEQKKGYLQKMFPKNGAKVPELRFAGFADDWEERKLGDLGSVAMNKRIFKEQTSDVGDIPFYKIGTFGGTPDAFISRDIFEEYKSKYQYPEVGDILISASGSIGRTVVYQGYDEYFQDSNIVWLKHDQQLDNSFLKQFYSIVKWQGLEGSTIKRLYNKNILETKITLPSPEEQQKIGSFFKQLDNTITLHQRKLDLLKEQKKGFLQKMFI